MKQEYGWKSYEERPKARFRMDSYTSEETDGERSLSRYAGSAILYPSANFLIFITNCAISTRMFRLVQGFIGPFDQIFVVTIRDSKARHPH